MGAGAEGFTAVVADSTAVDFTAVGLVVVDFTMVGLTAAASTVDGMAA
jgi:hypothetical protein